MIVVDSSIWIDLLRGHDTAAVRQIEKIERPAATVILGDLVLLEVLRGARDDQHADAIRRRLSNFRLERMLDDRIAVAAAGHYRALRRTGITVGKTTDLIIATFCMERGYTLLHADRDFEPLRALGLVCVRTT